MEMQMEMNMEVEVKMGMELEMKMEMEIEMNRTTQMERGNGGLQCFSLDLMGRKGWGTGRGDAYGAAFRPASRGIAGSTR